MRETGDERGDEKTSVVYDSGHNAYGHNNDACSRASQLSHAVRATSAQAM
jgi:hypothetical protein